MTCLTIARCWSAPRARSASTPKIAIKVDRARGALLQDEPGRRGVIAPMARSDGECAA